VVGPDRLLGLVLNGARSRRSDQYGYYE
jgi:hypothetical protein